MAAACKRLVQFSFNSSLRLFSRLAKPNGHDTSATVSKLEGQGVPTKQAQAITEVLNDSQKIVSESLMQRTETLQVNNQQKFKALEMRLQNEIERLSIEMEKRNSRLRRSFEAEIKAEVAEAKCDVGKYYIGTILSMCVWLAFLRVVVE